MPTTNLFALREARSNQECCFFRSTCQLGMSRHGEPQHLRRTPVQVSETNHQQPPAASASQEFEQNAHTLIISLSR